MYTDEIERRMGIINEAVARREHLKELNSSKLEETFQYYFEEVRKLKPSIQIILQMGNMLREAGIEVGKRNCFSISLYGREDTIGFAERHNPYKYLLYNYSDVNGIGVLSFLTDGEDMMFYYKDISSINDKCFPPGVNEFLPQSQIHRMEGFVGGFKAFQKDFFSYIDTLY